MGRRFGRNQKRRMRAQVDELRAMLAREQLEREAAEAEARRRTDDAVRIAEDIAQLEDAVRWALGDYSAALQGLGPHDAWPTEPGAPAAWSARYPDRIEHEDRARMSPILPFDPVARATLSVERARVTLHRLIVDVDLAPGDHARGAHVRIQLGDVALAHFISVEMVKAGRFSPRRMAAIVAAEMSDKLVRSLVAAGLERPRLADQRR